MSVVAQRELSAEVDIYRAALPRIPETSGRHALLAAMADPSSLWGNAELVKAAPYLHPKSRLAFAKPQTIDAFLAAVKHPETLPTSLSAIREVMLVDEKQARLIGPWGWDDFERTNKLARGTISMSRIGFDPERSEALLYAAYVCGSLCGHDMFVFLKREASGWIVVRLEGYGVF